MNMRIYNVTGYSLISLHVVASGLTASTKYGIALKQTGF